MDLLEMDVQILLLGRVDGGRVMREYLLFPCSTMVCVGFCQLSVMDPSTGERVSNLEELPRNEYREYIKVETDRGTEVATNMVIVCNGIKINSSAYRSAFGEWSLSKLLCYLETLHSPCHLNQHPVSPPFVP